MKLIIPIVLISIIYTACTQDKDSVEVQYQFDFSTQSDLSYFISETESDESGQVSIKDSSLDIDAVAGASVWFKEKLTAPLKIEYTVEVIDQDGPNDRVSDLNCFFMAIDPRCPDDIFSCPDSVRTGSFKTYHALRTYYVGYGGNKNSTTRFRRYPGYTEERPLLPEHDLADPYLLVPNEKMNISILVQDNTISYAFNGKVLFEMDDPLPYHEGWFAFRTVRNHMRIHDFKVTSL